MNSSPLAALFAVFVLGSACSPNTSTNVGCKTQGLFMDQSSCVSAAGTACEMTTLQSSADSKTLVCWKPSSQGLSLSTTGSGTSTSGSSGCSGNYYWTLGAWTPAACDGTVTQLTRTVTCTGGCPCNQPTLAQPATVSPCVPDLHNQQHYTQQCKALGGSTVPTPDNDLICSLPGNACPSGWSAYAPTGMDWTATQQNSAKDYINCYGGYVNVYTNFHGLGPLPIEFKEYCGSRNCLKCRSWDKVYAKVIRVGCY